jgi:hypothetical protein
VKDSVRAVADGEMGVAADVSAASVAGNAVRAA